MTNNLSNQDNPQPTDTKPGVDESEGVAVTAITTALVRISLVQAHDGDYVFLYSQK